MPGIESFSTKPGAGGGGTPLPQMQLQPQTPTTPTQLPFAEPPAPRTPLNLPLAPPNFSLPPIPEPLTNPVTKTAASAAFTLIQRGPAPGPAGAVAKAGVAAVQAGWALGQYIDEQNQPNYSSPPMPATYGKPQVLEDVQPGVVSYEVGGVYLVDDGSEYAFGGVTGPRPSVYVTSAPHPQFGGSNGNGALLSLDEKGVATSGQAFYRTQCYASLCGLKGYRIDKLIPKYADGTTGKNMAKPAPQYTTDPNYTGELTAPAPKPASEPQTETPSQTNLKPGAKLGPGQKTSPNLSKQPKPETQAPPRPDLSKAPAPAPVPFPVPVPMVVPSPVPVPTGSAVPSPTPNLAKTPLPSGSPSPFPAPKTVPSPLGSPSLQPNPCEPSPCMGSMNSTLGSLWDMLQYLLGLFEEKEEDVNVIVCDCVDQSPVYTSKKITVPKGTGTLTVLQMYEIATTKGLVCLGSSATVLSGGVKPSVVEIEVPLVQCEEGAPVDYKLKIPVAKGSELKTFAYFSELAEIRRHECVFATAVINDLTFVKLQNDLTGKAIGVEDYPAEMPASLISKDQGFFGNLIPDEPAKIPNLTRLVTQFIKYFDEVIGEWEIPIQIKDTDPTTPGDQPTGIRLPNLAEAQAEQFTMAFQSTVNIDLLINIATRILAEVGQIKQQGFKSYGLTQTIVDYLNYEYGEEAKDMPLSFAPGKERFDELLKETVQKVAYPEYTDKDNFKVALTRLLESAAIVKALNWRKVDPGGDVKGQIIKTVLARAKQLDDEMKRQQDDLDKFVVEAEKGYPTLPGIPNPGEPYGEPYANRPIVKRVEE